MSPKLPRGRIEYTERLRSLPYRPTFKLTRLPEDPGFGRGWKSQAFRDERGNRYERDRDGEWERWSLVLERRRGQRGRVLYQADLMKRELDEHGDCLDRIDDFRFSASAILGLIDDAQERRLFSDAQLRGMRHTAQELFDRAHSLRPAIEERKKNGHA